MVECLLLAPLAGFLFSVGFRKPHRWLYATLASAMSLPPTLSALVLVTEGPIAGRFDLLLPGGTAVFLPFQAGATELLFLAGLTLCFWSVFLRSFFEEEGHPSELAALAFLQFSLTGLALSHSPLTLALFWLGSAVAFYYLTASSLQSDVQTGPSRVLGIQVFSLVCLVAALAGLYPSLDVPLHPSPPAAAAFWIVLLLGCVSRLGIWPFHSSTTWTAHHCRPHLAGVLSVVYPLTGLIPLLKIAGPDFLFTASQGLALVSVLYLSLCALGERQLYRFLAYVRSALASILFLSWALGTESQLLGMQATAQMLTLVALFTFFYHVKQTWIWTPDGSPGFRGLWRRQPGCCLFAAGLVATGATVPSALTLHPQHWLAVQSLPLSSLFVFLLGAFVLSLGLAEKYRAIFLTPGEPSERIRLSAVDLAPTVFGLALMGVTSVVLFSRGLW